MVARAPVENLEEFSTQIETRRLSEDEFRTRFRLHPSHTFWVTISWLFEV